MNFTDSLIILLRRNFRESDRIVSAFSLEHGRISLRFPGVNKSCSKLKALSEPFAYSCARVYMRGSFSVGCVTGGRLETVFPQIRQDYRKMNLAFYFCELMHVLTASYNPNAQKFYLLETSLNEIASCEVTSAIAPAFLLRLMQLGGFGLRDMALLDIEPAFWAKMHELPLSALCFEREQDLMNLNKTRYICQKFLAKYLDYPLKTMEELSPEAFCGGQEYFRGSGVEPIEEALGVIMERAPALSY